MKTTLRRLPEWDTIIIDVATTWKGKPTPEFVVQEATKGHRMLHESWIDRWWFVRMEANEADDCVSYYFKRRR